MTEEVYMEGAVDLENPVLKGLREASSRAAMDKATGFAVVLTFPHTANIAISGVASGGIPEMISMLFRGAVTLSQPGKPKETTKEVTSVPDDGPEPTE